MKRARNLYEKIISFENILDASRKARKRKRFKYSTMLFELELEKNIITIMDLLQQKLYKPGFYNDFYIYKPKKRLISAAPYFDRVIHHALMNVIEPILAKSFIHDTYSCIKEKGTHRAVQRYKQFQKKNNYVLKCDIKKYFFNIDFAILLNKIKKKIKCRDTLWLIETILESKSTGDTVETEYFPGDDLFSPFERKRGIPIGNLTSQFFSNFYLNDFDHFVKERLKAHYYIRYCDDFVIFGNDKAWLNNIKAEIINYLGTLRLKLHENKTRIFQTSDGVDFLGYRIYPEYIHVRKRVVKQYRKNLKKMACQYRTGKINLKRIHSSIQSWLGHVKHANSYKLREEILGSVSFISGKKGARP